LLHGRTSPLTSYLPPRVSYLLRRAARGKQVIHRLPAVKEAYQQQGHPEIAQRETMPLGKR
jgi:hypothetical protein